jgi:DNA polymerase III subunit delta'
MSMMTPWQQTVFDKTLAIAADGRLAHALCLVGPEKMGKREVALQLAKALLCTKPKAGGAACGQCRGCELLMAGTHPDFLDVTYALNEKTGKLYHDIVIDQIRRLSQWFSLTPQLGGSQVCIIHPADAMNFAASNALLKTLEEPSQQRFLILVTDSPGRLPATIRSRCQRVEFRLPDREQSLDWLKKQGHSEEAALFALIASRGHPGLALDWLAHGGLQLRREVQADLNAVAGNKMSPIELAQRWLGDEQADLRLQFAADLSLSAAAQLQGAAAPQSAGNLSIPKDFMKLSQWFDALNRLRSQLDSPIRSDLLLAGLLRDWRSMQQ